MENLLSPKMLADYLGLAEQTIYNRHSSGGDLPKIIKLGRLLRFRQKDVEVWLDAKSKVDTVCAPTLIQAAKPRRRGRPTKSDEIAARRAR